MNKKVVLISISITSLLLILFLAFIIINNKNEENGEVEKKENIINVGKSESGDNQENEEDKKDDSLGNNNKVSTIDNHIEEKNELINGKENTDKNDLNEKENSSINKEKESISNENNESKNNQSENKKDKNGISNDNDNDNENINKNDNIEYDENIVSDDSFVPNHLDGLFRDEMIMTKDFDFDDKHVKSERILKLEENAFPAKGIAFKSIIINEKNGKNVETIKASYNSLDKNRLANVFENAVELDGFYYDEKPDYILNLTNGEEGTVIKMHFWIEKEFNKNKVLVTSIKNSTNGVAINTAYQLTKENLDTFHSLIEK